MPVFSDGGVAAPEFGSAIDVLSARVGQAQPQSAQSLAPAHVIATDAPDLTVPSARAATSQMVQMLSDRSSSVMMVENSESPAMNVTSASFAQFTPQLVAKHNRKSSFQLKSVKRANPLYAQLNQKNRGVQLVETTAHVQSATVGRTAAAPNGRTVVAQDGGPGVSYAGVASLDAALLGGVGTQRPVAAKPAHMAGIMSNPSRPELFCEPDLPALAETAVWHGQSEAAATTVDHAVGSHVVLLSTAARGVRDLEYANAVAATKPTSRAKQQDSTQRLTWNFDTAENANTDVGFAHRGSNAEGLDINEFMCVKPQGPHTSATDRISAARANNVGADGWNYVGIGGESEQDDPEHSVAERGYNRRPSVHSNMSDATVDFFTSITAASADSRSGRGSNSRGFHLQDGTEISTAHMAARDGDTFTDEYLGVAFNQVSAGASEAYMGVLGQNGAHGAGRSGRPSIASFSEDLVNAELSQTINFLATRNAKKSVRSRGDDFQADAEASRGANLIIRRESAGCATASSTDQPFQSKKFFDGISQEADTEVDGELPSQFFGKRYRGEAESNLVLPDGFFGMRSNVVGGDEIDGGQNTPSGSHGPKSVQTQVMQASRAKNVANGGGAGSLPADMNAVASPKTAHKFIFGSEQQVEADTEVEGELPSQFFGKRYRGEAESNLMLPDGFFGMRSNGGVRGSTLFEANSSLADATTPPSLNAVGGQVFTAQKATNIVSHSPFQAPEYDNSDTFQGHPAGRDDVEYMASPGTTTDGDDDEYMVTAGARSPASPNVVSSVSTHI